MNTEVVQDAPSTTDVAPSGGDSSASQVTATPTENQSSAADPGAGSTDNQPPHENAPADKSPPLPLTNSRPVAPNTQSQPEVIDPASYKALRDEKSTWGRQMAETRRQYEETRKQLAQLQQDREKANQLAQHQKLALHDPRHPDHVSKFQPTLAKADIVRAQLARLNNAKAPDGLTPEQGQMWKESQREMLLGSLDESEQAALEQFQTHNQNFQRKLALNAPQALTEFVGPMLEQFWRQKQSEQQAAQAVDADLADPIAGPVLKEMQGEMLDVIKRLGGTDEAYDFVKQQAVTYAHNKAYSEQVVAENARLKQQLQELGVKVGVANTQQALAKGKASITRDVVPRHTESPYQVALKQAAKDGMKTDSPQFFQLIREIEAEQASRK